MITPWVRRVGCWRRDGPCWYRCPRGDDLPFLGALHSPGEVRMPGPVFRGAEAAPSAIWKDGTLFDRDGVTPLLGQIRGGWGVGLSATTAWRVQGHVVLKGSSSAPFCRVAQAQVLKGNSYEVLYRLMGDGITRASGREIVARGPGLSPDELLLAALVFDKA